MAAKPRLLRLREGCVQRAAVRHVRRAELGRPRGLRPARPRQSRILGARRRPRARLPAASSTNRAIPAPRRRAPAVRRRQRRLGPAHRSSRSAAWTSAIGGATRRSPSAADRSSTSAAARRRATPPHGLEAQAESLGRLSWMYLRLLVARGTHRAVLGDDRTGGGLDRADRASSSVSCRRRICEPSCAAAWRARSTSSPARRSARRGRAQAHVHRRRARAHRAAGRADPRAGGAVDRSRSRCRSASTRLPRRSADVAVDSRPAAGLRRDGGSADRAAAARHRHARARRRRQ